MNRSESSNLEAVDHLLSRFMQSEMPNPWPKAPSVQAGPIVPSSSLPAGTSPLVGSRLSLAASVAIIVGGCWLLSNLLSDRPTPTRAGSLEGGTAGTKHLEKLMKGTPKK